MQNCVILPIECDGRDKALRIFNTLNNRCVSLSPADIFKGLIFTNKNDKDRMEFAKEWQALENQIQNSSYLKKEDISFYLLNMNTSLERSIVRLIQLFLVCLSFGVILIII